MKMVSGTNKGYLITALGTIPDQGEQLSFDVDNVTLVAEEMEGTRLLKLRAIFHEEKSVEPEEERRVFRKEFEEDEPRR